MKLLVADEAQFQRDNKAAWQERESTCADVDCLIAWYERRATAMAHIVEASPGAESPDCAPLYEETNEQRDERYHLIASSYAMRRHGESEADLYRRLDSSPANVEAFAIAAEDCGASIHDALQSMDNLKQFMATGSPK